MHNHQTITLRDEDLIAVFRDEGRFRLRIAGEGRLSICGTLDQARRLFSRLGEFLAVHDAPDAARLRPSDEPDGATGGRMEVRCLCGAPAVARTQDGEGRKLLVCSDPSCRYRQPDGSADRTDIVQSMEALRAAGGDAWDKVEDPGAYLGRPAEAVVDEADLWEAMTGDSGRRNCPEIVP